MARFNQERRDHALELVARWQDEGDLAARARLIAMHAPIVGKVLSRFRARAQREMQEDLMAAGLEGLCVACDRFDRTKGTTFGTYAHLWVKAHVLEYLFGTRLVRGKTRTYKRIWYRVGRVQRELERRGAEATPEALAAHFGVDVDELNAVLATFERTEGFDAPVGREGHTLADQLAADAPPADELFAERQREIELVRAVHAALATLTPRQRSVIELRLLRDPALSLRAVGAKLGVSGERARQIEAEALDILRARLAPAAARLDEE